MTEKLKRYRLTDWYEDADAYETEQSDGAHVRYADVEEFLREVIRREEKAHDAWRATADENGMIKTACPEAERVYALSPLAAMARVLLGEEE